MTRKKVSPEIYALSTIMFVVILRYHPHLQRHGEPRLPPRPARTERGRCQMKRFVILLLTAVLALTMPLSALAAGQIEVTEDISVSERLDRGRGGGL